MKRKIAIMLIVAMLAVLLAACSSSTSGTPQEPAATNEGSESKPATKFPEKTIQIISPTKAGGATDTSARLMAQYLQDKLGESVVVVNQDGGGGSVGCETVRNADPDGYTLLYNHTMLPCNYYSGKYQYSYRDFKPIVTMAFLSQTIAVRSDAPWNNLKELVEDAKVNPGKYIFGVQFGSVSNFLAGTLMNNTGVEFKLVDSGGEAEKLTSLQGGHLDVIQATVGASKQYVEAGKMKVLAVANSERDPLGKEFPTAKEQGYDVSLPTMHTLYGPKDLPEDIVTILNEAFADMAEDKEFMEKLNKAGQNFVYRNVEETLEFIEQEDSLIKSVAEKLGMTK